MHNVLHTYLIMVKNVHYKIIDFIIINTPLPEHHTPLYVLAKIQINMDRVPNNNQKLPTQSYSQSKLVEFM